VTILSHDYTGVSIEEKQKHLAIANEVRTQNKYKVLDVCCRRFPRGYGVDLHPESNADWLHDVHDLLPLEDKSFDLTLCVEGIEHLFNPAKAVQEWARVTKYALCITTQNAHCWRRWLRLPKPFPFKLCTSPDHIYLWDWHTYENFFKKALPDATVKMEWYDRYLKKTRILWPAKFFRENLLAFVWLPEYRSEDLMLFLDVYGEAKRLVNFRPEHYEYSDRRRMER